MICGSWYWGILVKVAWLMQCSTRSANTLLYANHELKIIPTTGSAFLHIVGLVF